MISRASVAICIAAVAAAGIGAAAAAFHPWDRSSSASAAPSLSALIRQLTSADPGVEAKALAPGGTQGAGQPATMLPAGAALHVEPETWQVTGTDAAGAAAAGRIRVQLIEPGRQVTEVYLDLVRIGGRWLLYETRPA